MIHPIWKPEITAGNIVSWTLAIFVAGGAVFVLKYQVDNLIEQSRIVAQRQVNFEDTVNQKISALESQISNERVGRAEISGSIQAIERSITNIERNLEALSAKQR